MQSTATPDATVKITSRRTGKRVVRRMHVLDLDGRVVGVFQERRDRAGNGKGEWFVPTDAGFATRRNRFNFYTLGSLGLRATAATRKHKGDATITRLP